MIRSANDDIFDDDTRYEFDRAPSQDDELDAAEELQFNQHRHFDPIVGRWINEDPAGFEAGDANLYRYVGNAPCNDTDPTVE